MLRRIRKSTYDFALGYYNILLLALFLLFIFRPPNSAFVHEGIWDIVLAFVLVIAIFTCRLPPLAKALCSLIAIPIVALSFLTLFISEHSFAWLNPVLIIIFMAIGIVSVMLDLIVHNRVTGETLKSVICAYLLIGFLFTFAFYLVEIIQPGSIHIAQELHPIYDKHAFLAKMFYFSFTTLLTIGYGDILALTNPGQTLVVIEGIISHFYMAILVAKLVSTYSNRGQKT